ncbi:alginate lyase-domain-containing protein [Mycena leptocephala]|nr:alginate lyase-domain-containing protein [Mycena leptocephala]
MFLAHRFFLMPPRFTLLLFVPLFVCHWALATNPFTQYAVDFPDPNYVTAGQFGAKFGGAEATIVAWADEMASYGPWSVTNKPVVAPSGDKHDYMSWAPYQWPDCSNVHNTTVLSPSDIRKLCNYVFRDGQVNPDRNTIQDSQSFSNLSDAVLYNSIADMLQNKSSSVYSQNVAKFINTWFLDADTAMNPNLNYAQMNLGPGGQNGTYTGILPILVRDRKQIYSIKEDREDFRVEVVSRRRTLVLWRVVGIAWAYGGPIFERPVTHLGPSTQKILPSPHGRALGQAPDSAVLIGMWFIPPKGRRCFPKCTQPIKAAALKRVRRRDHRRLDMVHSKKLQCKHGLHFPEHAMPSSIVRTETPAKERDRVKENPPSYDVSLQQLCASHIPCKLEANEKELRVKEYKERSDCNLS